ncbi:MAG: helix-turn-helix domain-containing protein [Thermodesulfobacteriota bacterium]
MEFKDRLSLIIETLGVDKKVLAKQCGIGRATIFNYLNGNNVPDIKFLNELKKHYPQVNIDWLITGVGDPDLYKRGPEKVVGMDLAVQIVLEVEQEEGVKLNPRQREAVVKILRKEIERRNEQSKKDIRDLVTSFTSDGNEG